ncbi:MAG TPA: ISL3 family transposase [Stellaceae bacterium]|nr:ISL3 family transposase [Stellaceae bacterium]
MEALDAWSPAPNLKVLAVERERSRWTVTVDSQGHARCPICGMQSSSRHSFYSRTLGDLSAQGMPVSVRVRVARWRCRNQRCDRRIFAERLPRLAVPFARQTDRLAEIVRLFGYSAGGRPSERLMTRLGMRVSDTTILRHLKQHAGARPDRSVIRIVGVDEWAWRKGMNYGTVIVDLQRRRVVDLLADRVAATMADWFRGHPEIEVIGRDRDGLYADAARQGAPQARQIADRFHLLQNLRGTIARQLGGFEAPIRQSPTEVENSQEMPEQPAVARPDQRSEGAERERLRRRAHAADRAMFDEIRALYDAGSTVRGIARKLGLGRRRVYRWVRRIDMPEHSTMAPKPSTPAYFAAFLARHWADGTSKVRHLFSDIRDRGYTGSYSHLARFLATWRRTAPPGDGDERSSVDEEAPAALLVRAIDPMTGRRISPLTAAALCVKPRGDMTARQIVNVDALKAASAEFTTLRRLAMRFRGLLRGRTAEKLDIWLNDASRSGIYGIQRFARTLRQDIEAVRNAVLEPWSNGQTEGQINRLKTLKRAMYGRAGVDLLRARLMPLPH